MSVGSKRTTLTAAIAVLWLIGVGVALDGTDVAVRASTVSVSHTNTPSGHPGVAPANTGAVPSIAALRALALQGGPATTALRTSQMSEVAFKNVTALKGISVDEFMGTMGLMAAALGYCCSNCHTGAGTQFVNWEDDSFPEKRTARRMVTMVQNLNKESFGGRQVVTCWTCHRGRDYPVVTPEMDTVYSEPRVELDDILRPAPGVPSADELLNKYYAAIGGVEKVSAVTSIVAKGKSVFFGGLGGGGQVEFYAKAPDQRAVYIHFPEAVERGDSIRTFNGRTGWVATPLAVLRKYELTTGELDGARLDAQLSFPGQIKQVLTNLRVGPPTEIGDRTVLVLQGNGPRGSVATLYFDRESGLLVRLVRFIPSAIGRVPTQIDYSDYRDVGGIKFPYTSTFSWLDGRDTFQLSDVQLNVSIDPKKFDEPMIQAGK